MKKRNFCLILIFLFYLCSICIAQETEQKEDIWQPKAVIWIDISGSMKNLIESAKKDLRDILFFSPFSSTSINGFYSRKNDPTPIYEKRFSSLKDIQIASDPGTTLSPLDEGLKRGIKEIKDEKSPDNSILLFVTDEWMELKPGEKEKDKCVSLFRNALKEEIECPWAFFFEKNGYRIYVLIHYKVENTHAKDKEIITKRYLKFMNTLSEQLDQNAVLFKFDYPHKEAIFKAIGPSPEKKKSGEFIDTSHEYILSYVPRSYELVEAKLQLDTNDNESVINVNGYSGQSIISPSDISISFKDGSGKIISKDTILLNNINRENHPKATINHKFQIPKHNLINFLLFQDKGHIEGHIKGKIIDATFIPFGKEYDHLDFNSADRIIGSSAQRPVDISFKYEILTPPWFWWLRAFFIFIILTIIAIIVIISYIREKKQINKINILINNSFFIGMDFNRDDQRKLTMNIDGEEIDLGYIRKTSANNNVVFSPSSDFCKIKGDMAEKSRTIRVPLEKDKNVNMEIELINNDNSVRTSFILGIQPITEASKNKIQNGSSRKKPNKEEVFRYNDIDLK